MAAHNFIDRTGRRFGGLVAIRCMGPKNGKGNAQWLCRCDCGKETIVTGGHLANGHTRSCGCYKAVATSNAKLKHGHSHQPDGKCTKEYRAWLNMKRRCCSPKAKSYKLYGGRGIKVCDQWMNSFESFLKDVGPCPDKKMSIERIRNNEDYKPGNCKWASLIEQANNKRNNVNITFRNTTLTLFQWARRVALPPKRLWARINYGWTIERALTEPVRNRHSKKTQRE